MSFYTSWQTGGNTLNAKMRRVRTAREDAFKAPARITRPGRTRPRQQVEKLYPCI